MKTRVYPVLIALAGLMVVSLIGQVQPSESGIGTANLDNRSFRLNFENAALVADRLASRAAYLLAPVQWVVPAIQSATRRNPRIQGGQQREN